MNDYGAFLNVIDRENLKWYAKKLFQCHFIHYKPHVDWHGLGSERLRRITARVVAWAPCIIYAFFLC